MEQKRIIWEAKLLVDGEVRTLEFEGLNEWYVRKNVQNLIKGLRQKSRTVEKISIKRKKLQPEDVSKSTVGEGDYDSV